MNKYKIGKNSINNINNNFTRPNLSYRYQVNSNSPDI